MRNTGEKGPGFLLQYSEISRGLIFRCPTGDQYTLRWACRRNVLTDKSSVPPISERSRGRTIPGHRSWRGADHRCERDFTLHRPARAGRRSGDRSFPLIDVPSLASLHSLFRRRERRTLHSWTGLHFLVGLLVLLSLRDPWARVIGLPGNLTKGRVGSSDEGDTGGEHNLPWSRGQP